MKGCTPVLPIAAAFLFAGMNYAVSLPIRSAVIQPRSNSGVVMIDCKPGTPNCVTVDKNAPTPCNPCTIDGGKGPFNGSGQQQGTLGANEPEPVGGLPGVRSQPKPTVPSGDSSHR
jgi:hypothetical protein